MESKGSKLLAAWLGERSAYATSLSIGIEPERFRAYLSGDSKPSLKTAALLETWVRELGNVGQRPIDDPLVAEWNAMHSRLDKLIASDDAEEAAS